MNTSSNINTVLADLVGIIQHFQDSVNSFLLHIGDRNVLNPFQNANLAMANEPSPKECFERYGIQKLILTAPPEVPAFDGFCKEDPDHNYRRSNNWNDLKSDALIAGLKVVFGNCTIIQFANNTSVHTVANFWDGLLSDVIRPLKKKDFRFMFSPGDFTTGRVFEADEMLDIIGGYSSYGKVALIMEENEAEKLWAIIDGGNAGSEHINNQSKTSMEKYQSIFNTIRVDGLVILSNSRTSLVSKECRLAFTGRPFSRLDGSNDARNCFDAGYQMGLLMELQLPHCVAMGLVVSGSFVEKRSVPDANSILRYTRAWMTVQEAAGIFSQ